MAVLGDPAPVGGLVVEHDPQHPAGHRRHEDAVCPQLGDELLRQPGRHGRHQDPVEGRLLGRPEHPGDGRADPGPRQAGRLDVARPVTTRSGTRSTPSTDPVGPTSSASRAVVQPEPEPTSSTRFPVPTRSARSMARTVVGWLLVWP